MCVCVCASPARTRVSPPHAPFRRPAHAIAPPPPRARQGRFGASLPCGLSRPARALRVSPCHAAVAPPGPSEPALCLDQKTKQTASNSIAFITRPSRPQAPLIRPAGCRLSRRRPSHGCRHAGSRGRRHLVICEVSAVQVAVSNVAAARRRRPARESSAREDRESALFESPAAHTAGACLTCRARTLKVGGARALTVGGAPAGPRPPAGPSTSDPPPPPPPPHHHRS